MKKLRQLHLYSGCVFAPLLIFFAISGIWQTIENHWGVPAKPVPLLHLLSTAHISKAHKIGPSITSSALSVLAIVMSLSLVFTIVLGVVIAFRLGHRKAAIGCLVVGVVAPVALAFLAYR